MSFIQTALGQPVLRKDRLGQTRQRQTVPTFAACRQTNTPLPNGATLQLQALSRQHQEPPLSPDYRLCNHAGVISKQYLEWSVQQNLVTGMLKALTLLKTAGQQAAFIQAAFNNLGAQKPVKDAATRAADSLANQATRKQLLQAFAKDPRYGNLAQHLLYGAPFRLQP